MHDLHDTEATQTNQDVHTSQCLFCLPFQQVWTCTTHTYTHMPPQEITRTIPMHAATAERGASWFIAQLH
eukprot:1160714-Pelagomonas_calceolata.AAC.12